MALEVSQGGRVGELGSPASVTREEDGGSLSNWSLKCRQGQGHVKHQSGWPELVSTQEITLGTGPLSRGCPMTGYNSF